MRTKTILAILLAICFLGLIAEVIVNWDGNDYNSRTTREYREMLREGKDTK